MIQSICFQHLAEHHEEPKVFCNQTEVLPSISMVLLIKWPASVFQLSEGYGVRSAMDYVLNSRIHFETVDLYLN